jgi:hypothetical protein
LFVAQGQIPFQPLFGGRLVVRDPNAPPPNSPPELAPIGSKETTEGQQLTFGVSATDPDGHTPSLWAAPLPGTSSFTDYANGTGQFDWTPGFDDAGVYNVIFYATDSLDPSLVDSEAVQITVLDSNRAPVLVIPSQPQTVDEGDTLLFVVTANDPDGTTPSLEAFPALPPNMVFVDSLNGVGVLSFMPDFTQGNDDPTSYFVAFRARDEADPGLFVESPSYELLVYNVNRAPEIDFVADFGVCEGDSVNLVLTASDPDNDSLTLWLTPLAPNMTFADQGDGTGNFAFAPKAGQAGVYPVTLYAADGVATSSQGFTITVLDCAGLDSGKTIIVPWLMHWIMQHAIIELEDTVYLGDFVGGHAVNDIDFTTLRINSSVVPTSTTVLPSFPGFTGAVLQIVSPIAPFLEGYGAFYDSAVYTYLVTGQFTDATDLRATGEVTLRGHTSGDLNRDGVVDVGDLSMLIGHLFRGEAAPQDIGSADVDGSCRVNVADITYLVAYLFRGGEAPHCTCGK